MTDRYDTMTIEALRDALKLRDEQNLMQSERITALIREKSTAEVGLETFERELNSARAEIEAVRKNWAGDIETIGEHLIEAANDNSMCEIYDNTIRELNERLHLPLAERFKDFEVSVDITVTVPVMVSARTEEEARDIAGSEWRDRWTEYDFSARDAIVNGQTHDSDDFVVNEC